MKIKPEVIKTIANIFELKRAMELADCAPQDYAEICEFILGDEECILHLTSNMFDLKGFVELFTTMDNAHILEEKIFNKFMACRKLIDIFYEHYSEDWYKLFMRADLSFAERQRRCAMIFAPLSKASFSKWYITSPMSFARLISVDLEMKDTLLKLAEDNGLASADRGKLLQEINKYLAKMQQEKADEQRKKDIAAEQKKFQVEQSYRRDYLFSGGFLFAHSAPPSLHSLARSTIFMTEAACSQVVSLVRQGASLEARDKNGETPLITAAQAGHFEMTLLLLSLGANVAVKDNDGYSPKLYRLFYFSDHDYEDEDDSNSWKNECDNPLRFFLSQVEDLENTYLRDGNKYIFSEIKNHLLPSFADSYRLGHKPLAALCSYVYNKVDASEQPSVCEFFQKNCHFNWEREKFLLATVKPPEKVAPRYV